MLLRNQQIFKNQRLFLIRVHIIETLYIVPDKKALLSIFSDSQGLGKWNLKRLSDQLFTDIQAVYLKRDGSKLFFFSINTLYIYIYIDTFLIVYLNPKQNILSFFVLKFNSFRVILIF